MVDSSRMARLRAAVLAAPAADLRKATGRIGEDAIRALPGPARPLANQLKRAGSPADLLRKVPNPQVVVLVADQVSDECLEVTRTLLGDNADDPTMEQLQDALAKVLELFDVGVVRVMLATVAVADAEASDKCDELLTTDERFALPEDVSAETSVARPVKQGPSEEVLAKRRERKEAKKNAKGGRATPPKHKKAPAAAPPPADDHPPHVPVAARRQPTNLPTGFTTDDPMVGAVVLAVIPFDGDLGAKTRPAVVIAAGDKELLVRPGYSEGGMQSRRWQSHPLADWVAAGLTKPTWIEPDARRVHRRDVAEPIGRVSDEDWNALV